MRRLTLRLVTSALTVAIIAPACDPSGHRVQKAVSTTTPPGGPSDTSAAQPSPAPVMSPTTTSTTAVTTKPTTHLAPTSSSPPPVLGIGGARFGGVGFGQVQPSRIYLGGDPTGDLRNIVWSNWGGSQAVGHGLSLYVTPNQSTSAGSEQPATAVAFDLGTCHGSPAYQAIEWYFPQHGGYFDPNYYINTCTGAYVPPDGGGFR